MKPSFISIFEDSISSIEVSASCDNSSPDCDCYGEPCDCDRTPEPCDCDRAS